MSFTLGLFSLFVCATCFNNALHWYTQVTTYPLFAWLGNDDFVTFHKEYQRRLPFSIYAPYTLLMATNAALFFVRPAGVGVGWVAALFILNAFIMLESVLFAAPVHAQLDRDGKDVAKINRLVRLNSLRLVAATASSAIALYLLVAVLSHGAA